jgi:hypothetical protein
MAWKVKERKERKGKARQGMAWVCFKAGYILTTLQIFEQQSK